jgi:large subunit ribosomal protein L30
MAEQTQGRSSSASGSGQKQSGQLRITQVRSVVGRSPQQRRIVRALGLRRIRHTVVQPDRPEVRGMIDKVAHLIEVEEVS